MLDMRTRLSLLIFLPCLLLIQSLFIFQNSYSDEQVQLLVRSDDMGCCNAVNRACIESYQNGISRSVEIMASTPWFFQAVEMLKQVPDFDVGVHLTLTSEWELLKWGPLTQSPTLVDPNGFFLPMTSQRDDFPPNTGFLESNFDLGEAEAELRAQIELVKKHIPQVTHLSAHMGTAMASDELRAITRQLADEYGLPIEFPNLKRAPRPTNWKESNNREALFINMLNELTAGQWLFVEHPGIDNAEMRGMGHKGYEDVARDRALVTEVFTSPKVKAAIEELGIELIGYDDLLSDEQKQGH